MRGTTCEQDASLAIIRRALRFERIVANAGVPTTTYSYDANGNLIQAGGWNYVWDYLNRMLASGYNNSTTTYAYDPSGARVLQTSTTSTTYYPNKYYSFTSTKSGANTYATSTNYVFNGDTLLATIDQPLVNGTATGTPVTRYLHPDHLGSTNAVTDQNGSLVQLMDYYPYGATRIATSTYPTNEKRQYIGQYSDTGTGLSYLNARYYNPQQGQFISQDPTFWGPKQNLKDPQSFNAYSYAEDNPVTLKDPLGLAATVVQQIAVLQAQVNILQGIISLYNSGFAQQASKVYTAYQTAFGGGGSSQSQSGASTPNSSIAPITNPAACYAITPNISGALNSQMRNSANNPIMQVDPLNKAYFAYKVWPGHDWDLKDKPEYSSKAFPNGFVFDGKHIPSDAPGNINYGYTGAEAGFSPSTLLEAGGFVQQNITHTSQPEWQGSYFHGDDPVDQIYILWGANLYYNR